MSRNLWKAQYSRHQLFSPAWKASKRVGNWEKGKKGGVWEKGPFSLLRFSLSPPPPPFFEPATQDTVFKRLELLSYGQIKKETYRYSRTRTTMRAIFN